MKTFAVVFDGLSENNYAWRPICTLEEMVIEYLRQPQEYFTESVLAIEGIQERFWRPEEFHGKAVEEKYHSALIRRDNLPKTRPIGGELVQRKWLKDVEDNRLEIDAFEKRIAEIDEYLVKEFGVGSAKGLPRTFDQYAGKHRIIGADEKPLTKKKMLELAQNGFDIKKWPYLFARLHEQLKLFDFSEEIAMLPRVLAIAAEDKGCTVEDLVEDDKYIDELGDLILQNNREGLRRWIEGYRPVRALTGTAPISGRRKRKEKFVIQESRGPEEMLPIFGGKQNGLFAGRTVIFTGAEIHTIDNDPIMREALRELLTKYVERGVPTMDPGSGPLDYKETNVIEGTKLKTILADAEIFRDEYRLRPRH